MMSGGTCQHGSNFEVEAQPAVDLVIGRYYAAPQGFETEPSEHLIGDEPGVGSSNVGGPQPS